MKKIILILLILSLFSISVNADRPILVIGRLDYRVDSTEAFIYSDVAIDSNGMWRRGGDSRDLWVGQVFTPFYDYGLLDPTTRVTVVKHPTKFSLNCEFNMQPEVSATALMIYSDESSFTNSFIGDSLISEFISSEASVWLEKLYKNSTMEASLLLEKVIQYDHLASELQWEENAIDLEKFLCSDINGDGIQDYVLLVSKKSDPLFNAVVMYMGNKGKFQKIIIEKSKHLDYGEVLPMGLVLLKDFNFDGKAEIFLFEKTTEESFPVVYGWDNGLKLIFRWL